MPLSIRSEHDGFVYFCHHCESPGDAVYEPGTDGSLYQEGCARRQARNPDCCSAEGGYCRPLISFEMRSSSVDLLTKAETVTVAAIEAGVPTLIEAREIIAEFHLMIRRKTEAGLILWIERPRRSRRLVRQWRREG